VRSLTQPDSLSLPPDGDMEITSHVLFQVVDQGKGIPGDQLEIIFERFQQVNASDSRDKGGTGLGLAICRNIVHQHGGSIWAESTLGTGSTFYFTLPIP
jgi:signal transduction histidine kinase